jgi:hypothetical protein
MKKIIIIEVPSNKVFADLSDTGLHDENEINFACEYDSTNQDSIEITLSDILIDGEDVKGWVKDRIYSDLLEYVKSQLPITLVDQLDDDAEITLPIETDCFKLKAETKDDLYTKRIRAKDYDEYGLGDALFYIDVSYDNYKRIKETKEELSKSNVISNTNIANYVYVNEIYDYAEGLTYENRAEKGSVYSARFEGIEVDFNGTGAYVHYPFKDVHGGLDATDKLFFSDIEEFFSDIEDEDEDENLVVYLTASIFDVARLGTDAIYNQIDQQVLNDYGKNIECVEADIAPDSIEDDEVRYRCVPTDYKMACDECGDLISVSSYSKGQGLCPSCVESIN